MMPVTRIDSISLSTHSTWTKPSARHLQMLAGPVSVAVACHHVRAWLARPCVSILHPGDRHDDELVGLLDRLGAGRSPTTG